MARIIGMGSVNYVLCKRVFFQPPAASRQATKWQGKDRQRKYERSTGRMTEIGQKERRKGCYKVHTRVARNVLTGGVNKDPSVTAIHLFSG